MIDDARVRNLLAACRETHERELDCDEFLARAPAYAEAIARGEPPPPEVAAHERLCASCREECAALLSLLARE